MTVMFGLLDSLPSRCRGRGSPPPVSGHGLHMSNSSAEKRNLIDAKKIKAKKVDDLQTK